MQTAILQANDQSLRMAWTQFQGFPVANPVVLYASRLLNGTWGTGAPVTTQGGSNQFPALAQLNNNTLYLFWAYKAVNSRHTLLYYITQNGGTGTFSKKYSPVPIANSTAFPSCALYGCNDTMPAASVGRDGTLWLVWTRENDTHTGTTAVMRQLWYKTLKNGVWSTEQNITASSDVNTNYQPSVDVGKDGTVRVVYARGIASNSVFQIYYVTLNGPGCCSPVPLTTQTTTEDDSPSITQDRNGTLWVFWSRNVPVGTTGSSFVLYDRSSANDGATWTIETALTSASCPSSGCVNSLNPAAVQSTYDKYLWVFFEQTDPNGGLLNVYALQSATCSSSCTPRTIAPVHDVAISYFSVNASIVYAGGFHNPFAGISESAVVQVFATLQNTGDYIENVTVALSATNTTIYNLGSHVLQVQPGSSGIIGFNFNTTGVKPARYGLSGNASLTVEPLGNRPDGLLSASNQIHLLPLGDVDQDGSVTITDVSVVFFSYGCTSPNNPPLTCSSRPNDGYNPWADINGNGIIDIVDVGVVSKNYGIYT